MQCKLDSENTVSHATLPVPLMMQTVEWLVIDPHYSNRRLKICFLIIYLYFISGGKKKLFLICVSFSQVPEWDQRPKTRSSLDIRTPDKHQCPTSRPKAAPEPAFWTSRRLGIFRTESGPHEPGVGEASGKTAQSPSPRPHPLAGITWSPPKPADEGGLRAGNMPSAEPESPPLPTHRPEWQRRLITHEPPKST